MRKLVFYNVMLITALAFGACTRYLTPVSATYVNSPCDSGLAEPDSSVIKIYLPYKENLDTDMKRVIAVSVSEMEKDKPESPLTNFMADLLLEEGREFCLKNNLGFLPDFSYMNYGGIRTMLPQGDITVGKIFELMPFENELVFIKLEGKDVLYFLNLLAEKGGDAIGGARFAIKNGKAIKIEIGGLPFEPGKTYWLATSDYIAGGGDEMEILKNRLLYVGSGEKIREMIIAYLENNFGIQKPFKVETDGRIRNE